MWGPEPMFNFLRRRAVETRTDEEIIVSISPNGFRGQRIVLVLDDAQRMTTKPPYRDFASAIRAVEGECYAEL